MLYKKKISAAVIAKSLQGKSNLERSWKLKCKPVCSSTEISLSKWLLEKPDLNNQPRLFLSSCQNYGVGQRGRVWHSPKGGVWLSAALPYLGRKQSPGLFGLAVAFALSERLENKQIQSKIKWPNDLLVFGRKLAGFLPRVIYRGDSFRLARIGIGMNVVNKVPDNGISLLEILGTKNLCVANWAAEVILSIERALELFEKEESFYLEVEKRLWASTIVDPNSGEIWDIEGLDHSGGLRVRRGNKKKIWNRWG